jgi:dienelactone hydrolase
MTLPALILCGMSLSAPDAGAWARLFADANSPAKASEVDTVVVSCKGDIAAVRKLIASDAAYPPFAPGWHAAPGVRVADGAKPYTVNSTLHVPAGYRPDKPCALLLVAHGQHMTGPKAAAGMVRMLGPAAANYIILAPTLPGADAYNGRAYQEETFLRPLDWARRALNVDDDRVIVTGYSLGGHTTWHLATLFPHRFAAGVAMAGTPFFEGFPYTATMYLENLGNLALWSIWGELDRPAPPARGQVHFNRDATARLKALGNQLYQGAEIAGGGHGSCWPPGKSLSAYLAAAKRQPVPPRLTHAFHLPAHGRGYYLQAMQFARPAMQLDQPVRVRLAKAGNAKPTDEEFERATREVFEKALFRFSGELDKAGNALTIRPEGVRAVRVYVMDGMFDLSRDVTLKFGPRIWRGRVAPSARCVLTHYAATRDATALVLNELELTDAGKVAVKW